MCSYYDFYVVSVIFVVVSLLLIFIFIIIVLFTDCAAVTAHCLVALRRTFHSFVPCNCRSYLLTVVRTYIYMYVYEFVYLLTVNLHEVGVGHNRIWLTFFVWQQHDRSFFFIFVVSLNVLRHFCLLYYNFEMRY